MVPVKALEPLQDVAFLCYLSSILSHAIIPHAGRPLFYHAKVAMAPKDKFLEQGHIAGKWGAA